MDNVNRGKGYFMLIVLWCAYVTFAMNWVGGSSLTPQITQAFFGGDVDPVISQVVNYSITTARVFANILAALVLVKLGPKKAAVVAIGLLTMSLAAIYMPNYWAFTGARMLMALGGSMVIVYMNPVVARYISSSKERLRINAMNTVSYNVGAFVVALLFTLFSDTLTKDWQVTLTIFASLTLISFVAWILLAEDFDTLSSKSGKVIKYGYKDALKDPFLWKYGLGFGGFLTLYVLSLVSLKPVFDQYTLLNGSLINLLISGFGIIGTFVGMSIGNRGTPRKPILLSSGTIMIGAFAMTIIFANTVPTLAYIFAAISGFAMFIQYPIYMNLAHELDNMSPQKLTVIYGLFWAIAYALQTIVTIVWSFILGSVGYIPAMIFFFICTTIYLIFVSMLKETKPKIMKEYGKLVA